MTSRDEEQEIADARCTVAKWLSTQRQTASSTDDLLANKMTRIIGEVYGYELMTTWHPQEGRFHAWWKFNGRTAAGTPRCLAAFDENHARLLAGARLIAWLEDSAVQHEIAQQLEKRAGLNEGPRDSALVGNVAWQPVEILR